MSDKATDHDEIPRDELYRLTFGKHRGSTINELSSSYRQFLIEKKVHDLYPDFKAALIASGHLQTSQPANLEPISPNRKRKASEQTVPSSPQTLKKPALSTKQDSENATKDTGKQQDADSYVLEFGKHKGKSLRDVPSEYIDWMISSEVYANRPALKTALEALGRLVAPGLPLKDPMWKAPHVSMTRERCFSDPFLGSPLWISDKDTLTYFGLHDPTLTAAGVRLVSDKELDAYTVGGSLFMGGGGRRRWLYPVFACAEHFSTPSPGTARQALQRFLGKNKRREDEIMSQLGLGIGVDDDGLQAVQSYGEEEEEED